MEEVGRSFLKVVPVEAEVVIVGREMTPAAINLDPDFNIRPVLPLGGWRLHLQLIAQR